MGKYTLLKDYNKRIMYKSLGDNEEYCSFLKRQLDEGYRPIVVSSEMMIELIRYAVIHRGLKVCRIEFDADDDALTYEVSNWGDIIEMHPVMFAIFIEKLQVMVETSSANIKRIYLSGRLATGSIVDMYIQSNGIVAINDDADIGFVDAIIVLIERCLLQ